MAGTGLGGVISAMQPLTSGGISLASFNFVSITGYEETVEEIDDTHLGSTDYMETITASLASVPAMTADVQWPYHEEMTFRAAATTGLTIGESSTVTVKFPDRAGVTGGQVSGTAVILSIKYPDHTQGDRSIGQITFKFDGKTAPIVAAHA